MVSLVLIVPKSEIEVARTALEEAGYGSNNVSVAMVGFRLAERNEAGELLEQPTHYGTHWWADDATLEFIRSIRETVLSKCSVVISGAEVEGLETESAGSPLGLFNAAAGDSMVLQHKEFAANQWGWRAEMVVASQSFNPGVRAIAIYSDSEHQQFLYTTGAFVWNAESEVWATEWNENRANKADIHFALLFAAQQEARGTLPADRDAESVYFRFGLPQDPIEPEEPGVIEWAPGQVVVVGDKRTYQGITYTCIQSHTTQVGWTPPVVPALWAAD